MLSTTSLITDITQVPRIWIYEYYLNLTEKLNGQDVKIKSVFNVEDKKPSMCIYYAKNNTYMYKDFSSGKSGDAIDLVKEYFTMQNRGEACRKIMTDYGNFIKLNGTQAPTEVKKKGKFKVKSFIVRGWNKLDEKFWTKFHIGSADLTFFCVKPLESYVLEKTDDDITTELVINNSIMYGYFRKDGSLYKIYLPNSKEHKFIKVKEYIQGSDQLTLKVNYLVICSSLKDIIAFSKLGYKNAEAIAPDSENILISESMINIYKSKYKQICTLFDNDQPGIKSMAKYAEKYQIKSVLLPISKDLSDSIRDRGPLKVKEVLTPLLKQALQ